ncbi:hypothetical protein MPSEU_000996500 [Mayamaea pseudoterrestris]|nr:hypothetical protein MPSEU_000996500 [Mayamaea pseudoterrestris]
MEPTLRDGDVLFIRKSDFGIIPETLWNIIFDVSGNHDDQSKDRARLIRYESLHGIGNEQHARVYSNPPVALNGQVVVYKDPDAGIPSKLCVKRLVGVGGQLVRPKAWPGKLQQVPPYSLYVEGDNKANSRDSRQIGPISKGLLVGVAEYVLWPPTRMGQIQTTTELDDKGRPRASWL